MKNNHLIIFLSCIFYLLSCEQNKKEPKYVEIKLIDRFTNELKLDSANSLTVSEISPLYIGRITNEIIISYQNCETVSKTKNRKKYKTPRANSLEIFIDTTRTIGIPMGFYRHSKEEKRNDKIAYPFFMKNISKDTMNIGYAEFLPIIIEAKDRNGNWNAIQKKFTFDCGTGIQNFYFAPNNIIISSMKKFNGTFKTKLRLKYDFVGTEIYSNIIDGEINEKQFE